MPTQAGAAVCLHCCVAGRICGALGLHVRRNKPYSAVQMLVTAAAC